jgi:histidinol-phosphatase
MEHYGEDLELALDLGDLAGTLGLDYYQRGVATTWKDDGSPVTEADRAVETLLRDRLAEARPADGVLGEEFGASGKSARTWIIDPIDGTAAFVQDDPDWRVHIALEVNGVITVAVVVAPAQGRRWWASAGVGAFRSTWPAPRLPAVPALVSRTAQLAGATIEAFPLDLIAGRLAGAAPSSPTAVVPERVVDGQVDAFIVDGWFAWDHAPWILLVEEAGGRFTDWEGGRSAAKGGGIFSNSALHARLVEMLGLSRR